MATWGTGIYQNDVSEDVKDDYISKLRAGKSDEQALQEIMEEYKHECEDVDCMFDFFFALADVMWKKGRLTEEVKLETLALIEADIENERWNPKNIRKERIKKLEKLKNELNSKMPERKKIPIHKPYTLGWKEGEVYAFQIKSKIENYEEYMGWYVLFYVDEINKDDSEVRGIYDEVAELYFFLVEEAPTDANIICSATPVCFLLYNGKRQYRAELYETSKRQRPKDMYFVGICSSFIYPQNELPQNRVFSWRLYERSILWGYQTQLKLEQEKEDI